MSSRRSPISLVPFSLTPDLTSDVVPLWPQSNHRFFPPPDLLLVLLKLAFRRIVSLVLLRHSHCLFFLFFFGPSVRPLLVDPTMCHHNGIVASNKKSIAMPSYCYYLPSLSLSHSLDSVKLHCSSPLLQQQCSIEGGTMGTQCATTTSRLELGTLCFQLTRTVVLPEKDRWMDGLQRR